MLICSVWFFFFHSYVSAFKHLTRIHLDSCRPDVARVTHRNRQMEERMMEERMMEESGGGCFMLGWL